MNKDENDIGIAMEVWRTESKTNDDVRGLMENDGNNYRKILERNRTARRHHNSFVGQLLK